MTLVPGFRFGPYEVTSLLGSGGMGEVYRARDARLNRDVALKVLPPDVTADPDRLQRFRREAHVLASLNHQNIAAIYGLEQAPLDGSAAALEALVLELVEGPTLAERIAAGPLSVDDARAIGLQIASALEAAHERGIIHRDLKPANVKVRPDGTVKVLDFGLAKAWDPSSGAHSEVSSSPTFTSPVMTGAGIILGTAAYMSPEQARGAAVDRRTDVWAFGCVLFEMLAGQRAFGDVQTVSDAIAAILKSEPEWQALPASTPPHIRALLKRCLEKDPRRRLRDLGDAALLLVDDHASGEPVVPPHGATRLVGSSQWTKWVAITGWITAIALAIFSAVRIASDVRVTPSSLPSLRLALPLALPLTGTTLGQPFAISGDGTRAVYLGRDGKGSALYLHDLAGGESKRLPETADASAPAFSPDGRALAFSTGSSIKVLPLRGQLAREIAQAAGDPVRLAWSGPDHIVVADAGGLRRVSVAGGAPEVIAKIATGETGFGSVSPLPSGGYLVSVRTTTSTDDASRVAVVTPGESARLVVAERGSSPTFVAGTEAGLGHIVYAEAGRLMALPFDASRRRVLGSAVPVLENVAMRPNGDWANYSISATGTIVFREGTLHELVAVDRTTGAATPLSSSLRRFALPRLSPDGKRLAVEIQESPHQIWMLEIERDVLVPLTTEATGSHNFAWAPNGSSIAYTIGNVMPPQLGWIRTNGSPAVEKIAIAGDTRVSVDDWSRDGRLALLVGLQHKTLVMTVQLDDAAPPRASGAPVKIADGMPGSFSRDGAWLAYCNCGSSGDRPPNVFIQHLQSRAEYQVSTESGTEPVWAASSRELFFRAGSKMMAATLAFDGASVRIGRPRTLFEGDYLEWGSPNYDVTADDKHFVMVRPVAANTRMLSVRLHWPEELASLAPIPR